MLLSNFTQSHPFLCHLLLLKITKYMSSTGIIRNFGRLRAILWNGFNRLRRLKFTRERDSSLVSALKVSAFVFKSCNKIFAPAYCKGSSVSYRGQTGASPNYSFSAFSFFIFFFWFVVGEKWSMLLVLCGIRVCRAKPRNVQNFSKYP